MKVYVLPDKKGKKNTPKRYSRIKTCKSKHVVLDKMPENGTKLCPEDIVPNNFIS